MALANGWMEGTGGMDVRKKPMIIEFTVSMDQCRERGFGLVQNVVMSGIIAP